MRALMVILLMSFSMLGQAQQELDDLFKPSNATLDKVLNDAKEYYANGFFNKATKVLYRETKKHPDYFNGYIMLGYLNFDKQYYEQAALYFAKAIKIDPNHIGAIFMRGTCFLKAAKYRLALTDYLQCIRLDQDFYPAYNNIAVVRLLYQDLEEASLFDLHLAKQDLDAILTEEDVPDNAMLFNMGFVYLLLWEFDKSIPYFDKAVSADSSYAKAWFYRGMAQYYKRQYPEAKANFEQAALLGFQTDRCAAFVARLDKILNYIAEQKPTKPEGW
jgi:protein O-GlcNAc transferase